MSVRYFWTTKEIAVDRDNYPQGGVEACLPLLPGRTHGAVYRQAMKLGLRAPNQCAMRKRWENSDWIDGEISKLYQQAPTKNAVNELAERLGRPRWWVSKRAVALGITLPRFKEPAWTEDEEDLLAANVHKSAEVIRRIFAARGYNRTTTSITVKRKRLHLRPEDNGYYTATQAAGLMGVDMKTVQGWILKGLLQAKKRGTNRTEAQGGDMWWIRDKHLREFITDNAALVDIRKVDKFWFIELLAGKAA
jgi:hypothetical protein